MIFLLQYLANFLTFKIEKKPHECTRNIQKKYKKIIFDCTPLHDFLLHYNYALLRDFTTLKLLLYFYYYIDMVTPRRAIARQRELAGTLSRFNDLFSKTTDKI